MPGCCYWPRTCSASLRESRPEDIARIKKLIEVCQERDATIKKLGVRPEYEWLTGMRAGSPVLRSTVILMHVRVRVRVRRMCWCMASGGEQVLQAGAAKPRQELQ